MLSPNVLGPKAFSFLTGQNNAFARTVAKRDRAGVGNLANLQVRNHFTDHDLRIDSLPPQQTGSNCLGHRRDGKKDVFSAYLVVLKKRRFLLGERQNLATHL